MRFSLSKSLIVALDVIIAAYLVAAFTSFNKPNEREKMCSKVNINVKDGKAKGFITVAVIKDRLIKSDLFPEGKPLRYVDGRKIEQELKTSLFVKSVECYKTQSGQIYIDITQLLPVIRVKADNGDDYYLDDKSCIMPSSSYVSDLIIATGAISRQFAVDYISVMGKTIMANDMWRNMIEQINVLPDHGIEIVSRVGDHIVYLGQMPECADKAEREKEIADFIEIKLDRLVKFYRYGLSNAGWNKYSRINMEYDNQIICKKRRRAS